MDADLKQYLEAMEARMNERFRKLESGLEARLVETMHELQTELLRLRCSLGGSDNRVPEDVSGSVEP